MGWDNTVAFMKVTNTFKGDPGLIGRVIKSFDSSASAQSCNATMTVLSKMMCPNEGIKSLSVVDGMTGGSDPKKAIANLDTMLDGEEAIFISVSPDHHFVVLPLATGQVAMLQGFQDSYSLHDWINSGRCKMTKQYFMDNFRKLLSGSVPTIQQGAVALFSFGDHDDEIRDWFNRQTECKSLSSQHTNLFSGGKRANLAPPPRPPR